MTNREWLRGMSDEELAEKIIRINIFDPCKYCIYDPNCEGYKNSNCNKGVEAWLREEHKDGK